MLKWITRSMLLILVLVILAIVGVVAWEEHGIWAQPASVFGRHGRPDAVHASLVRRRGDHASLPVAADDDRLATEFGTTDELDGRVERIHVHMQDRRGPVGGAHRVTPDRR